MTAVLLAGDFPWEYVRMLEALRREQAERKLRHLAAEARDRRDWIEGIRRRLGLVSEVHEVKWWQAGEDYWLWACQRPGCPYANWRPSGQAAASMGRARTEASKHRRKFLPPSPEPMPGARLDLTGF